MSIIPGLAYELVNEQAQNLALGISKVDHKSIIAVKVGTGDVKERAVGIAVSVNTYCRTHVFVVDIRVPPGQRRGTYQITGRPQIVHRI